MKPMSLVAALACVLACGAPGMRADGGEGGAPKLDAPVNAVDAASEAADASAPSPEGGLGMTGLPLPADVPPPRLLLEEGATLTGAGRSACSHQEPPAGGSDRWCAFRRKGPAAGSTELWVMNVSAAARGGVPPCDGSSAACLRLTTALWPTYGNDFEGDTLVFYADAPPTLAPSAPFVGPVYAWRPGWTRARLLASRATVCVGHRRAPVALCFDDPTGKPDNPNDVQLRVGAVDDVSDAMLPALPGRWPFRTDGSVAWQLAFSPDGETFAVSLPSTAGMGGQSLSVIATRDVATGALRDHVLEGIEPWTIANDGKKIFFYRGPRSDATLVSADFPAGTNETTVATKVVEFVPLGRGPADLAVLLRVALPAGGHAFSLLRDRDKPETAVTLFTNEGFLEGLAISPDLRYTAWIDPDFRGSAIRNADLAACAINPAPAPSIQDVAFLADASLLFWSERRPGGAGARDGILASPDRCRDRVVYARGLAFLSPFEGRGIVFGDESDESMGPVTVTLKYAGFAGGLGEAASGGVRVHERVVPPVTLVGAGAQGPSGVFVIYNAAAAGGRRAGVYLFGPVPF